MIDGKCVLMDGPCEWMDNMEAWMMWIMRLDDMNAWLMEDMGGCMNDKGNGWRIWIHCGWMDVRVNK